MNLYNFFWFSIIFPNIWTLTINLNPLTIFKNPVLCQSSNPLLEMAVAGGENRPLVIQERNSRRQRGYFSLIHKNTKSNNQPKHDKCCNFWIIKYVFILCGSPAMWSHCVRAPICTAAFAPATAARTACSPRSYRKSRINS